MNEENIISEIKNKLQAKAIEITNPSAKRIFLKVNKEDLIETVKYLRDEFKFYHLSTITGLDKGEEFEILYHFANHACALTVRIFTPRANPKIPSICAEIPGAILYEREIQEMYGIIIENIPDSRLLLLPDDWEPGVYPLRKDWKFTRPEEIIPEKK